MNSSYDYTHTLTHKLENGFTITIVDTSHTLTDKEMEEMLQERIKEYTGE